MEEQLPGMGFGGLEFDPSISIFSLKHSLCPGVSCIFPEQRFQNKLRQSSTPFLASFKNKTAWILQKNGNCDKNPSPLTPGHKPCASNLSSSGSGDLLNSFLIIFCAINVILHIIPHLLHKPGASQLPRNGDNNLGINAAFSSLHDLLLK